MKIKNIFKKKETPIDEVKTPQCVELSDTDIKLIVQVLYNYYSQISNYNSTDIDILRAKIKDLCNRLQGVTNA